MGGFIGIGGSSAKTDRKNELWGFQGLKNIFNFALPAAKGAWGAGQEAIGGAMDYWTKILSGNRASMMQAEAPAINAVNAQADAEKRQVASMGTARGGGVAATNRQIESDKMTQINNALFGARPTAAKEEGRLGSEELNASLNALGIGGNAATNLSGIAADSRKTSFAINRSVQEQVATTIGAVLDAFV